MCSTCDCRTLLSLPTRPGLKSEPAAEKEAKKHGPDELAWPAVPSVVNKRRLDESADDYFGRAPFGSDGFLRGRPLPDQLRLTEFAFPSSMTAFTSPGSDQLISPGHADGLNSFGGRLDQVVPATPSEKGFITDTTADESAGGYVDVHEAFKEDRRGSACETLPHVDSPNLVAVSLRFSLPEPSLAALLFEPRAENGANPADDWQPQEADGGSEYQPQEGDDSGSDN
jgi:hypothetical protein